MSFSLPPSVHTNARALCLSPSRPPCTRTHEHYVFLPPALRAHERTSTMSFSLPPALRAHERTSSMSFSLPPSRPPALPPSLRRCACVCACVRACVRACGCIKHHHYCAAVLSRKGLSNLVSDLRCPLPDGAFRYLSQNAQKLYFQCCRPSVKKLRVPV